MPADHRPGPRAASGRPAADRCLQALVDLLRLSDAMLEAARAGDWAVLPELEVRRLRIVGDAAVPPGLAAGHAALIRERLQTILAMNQEILRLAGARRADLSDRLHRLAAGRTAVQAYADNSY